MNSSLRAYRTSAVEGATHIDVLLACYDALAEDIRLAGKAAEARDFSARCRYSQHALLLLGHLQSWAPYWDNEALKTNLTSFYGYLRTELLRLQSCVGPDPFSALAMTVCETRAVWQNKKSLLLCSAVPSASEAQPTSSGTIDDSRLCCSA